MKKERLFISLGMVRVEYEFLNESDRDIETEVAFPIPSFRFAYDDPGGPRSLDDFKVWVEGKQLTYATEIKAMVNGKDLAPVLRQRGIDANSFGNFDWDKNEPLDFLKLSKSERRELIKLGAFDSEQGHFAKWTVFKTYHWKHVFPAKTVLHVSHEYKPIDGFEIAQTSELFENYVSDLDRNLSDACVDEKTRSAVLSAVKARQSKQKKDEMYGGNWMQLSWVDYILTTANSWKMPIGDFELVIEKPKADVGERSFVSFCWDGPVEKLDNRHFVARAKNFVPKRELHIAFFN